MKKLSVFIPVFLTFVLVLSSLTPVSAQIIDQSNDVTRGPVANTSDWGQSFTPSMQYLYQVDLALSSVGNINTYAVTVYIRVSWTGTILGSATATVPPNILNINIGEFTSFIFDTPIKLSPGTPYIIQVPLSEYYHQGGTSDMISWINSNIDTYSGGTGIQNGIVRSEDTIFRTFGSNQGSNPVGGIYAPNDKLNIIAPYIALVGLIGAISTIFAIRRWYKD